MRKVALTVGVEGHWFNEKDIGKRVFSQTTLKEYEIVKRKGALQAVVIDTHSEGTVSVTGAKTIKAQ